MAKTSLGTCAWCDGEFSKTVMTRHLTKCPHKPEENGNHRLFTIQAQDRHSPEYWIYMEADADTTLEQLDNFLRWVWLECCGHMSVFYIEGTTYSTSPSREFGDKSMTVKLGKILTKGLKISHAYDMGSTTTLTLKVVNERAGAEPPTPVSLLARNLEPVIACSNCGEQAVDVCTECIYDDGGWLCETCSESHDCGEDMLLPVVNSPRVGVCGYTG